MTFDTTNTTTSNHNTTSSTTTDNPTTPTRNQIKRSDVEILAGEQEEEEDGEGEGDAGESINFCNAGTLLSCNLHVTTERIDSDDVESSSLTCDSSSLDTLDTTTTSTVNTITTNTTTDSSQTNANHTLDHSEFQETLTVTPTSNLNSFHHINEHETIKTSSQPPSHQQDSSSDSHKHQETIEANTDIIGSSKAKLHEKSNGDICYNQVLDDEIRNRLDKLNALSDLINSLERQFDEANSVFRETLKCSTERLSTIAKALGKRSIRQGRIYHAAKLSVEQTQSDCQKACVQFEQANKDRQFAKKAIQDAETKLKQIAGSTPANSVIAIPSVSITDSLKFTELRLSEDLKGKPNELFIESCASTLCDKEKATLQKESLEAGLEKKQTKLEATCSSSKHPTQDTLDSNAEQQKETGSAFDEPQVVNEERNEGSASDTIISNNAMVDDAAKLSEELNQAVVKLFEAEKKRGISERQHLDQANRLMIAQENLTKLERDHGPSIRRSQFYFEEAKRFNAKLNSVKGDICRISENIIATKQAYAQTLSELERFSEDLHDLSQQEKHDDNNKQKLTREMNNQIQI